MKVEDICQVREMAWFWLQDYNQNRTHESLNHLPPEAYRKQLETLSWYVLINGAWTLYLI